MKTLIRTLIVLIVVNLVATGLAFAQVTDTVTSDFATAQSELAQHQAVLASNQSRLADITRRSLFGSWSRSAGDILVIPSGEITTEEIAKITEDMNIMSRIFAKNLQQTHIQVSNMIIGSDPFQVAFARSKQATQGMYLQGYGALYMMKVDFPLSPGPKKEEEQETKQKTEDDVDPVWSQTKQDMLEPEKSRKDKNKRPEKVYDAKKVENLKTTLVQSLKHATNIRSLTPDESVILTVTGSNISSGYKSVRAIYGSNEVVVVDQNNRTRILGTDPMSDISLPTVLVIRAKKSDIDRFAKGDLDFDQFQQAAQILTSAYLTDQSGWEGPMMSRYYGYSTSRR